LFAHANQCPAQFYPFPVFFGQFGSFGIIAFFTEVSGSIGTQVFSGGFTV
jgi:hypothetical protein